MLEYICRGGRVVVQPVTDGEWLTIGEPINYMKSVFEYEMGAPEARGDRAENKQSTRGARKM